MKYIFFSLITAYIWSCGGVSDSIESLGNGVFYIHEGGEFNQIIIGQKDEVGVIIHSVLLSRIKDIIIEKPFVYAKSNGLIDTSSIQSYISRYSSRDNTFNYELTNEGEQCSNCWFIIDIRSQNTYGPISPTTFEDLRK